MIKELKTYRVTTPNQIPTEDDIRAAINIAKVEHCYINIEYYIQYSGWYIISIGENSTIEAVQEQIKGKIYPV